MSCVKQRDDGQLARSAAAGDFNAFEVMQPRAPAPTPLARRNGARGQVGRSAADRGLSAE